MAGPSPLCLLLAFSALLDGQPGRAERSAEPCSPCPEDAQAGSCGARRRPPACCSPEEAPLDQRRCSPGGTRGEEPSLPSARDNWSTILVFIIIASIALVSVGIFFFYPQIWTCLRSCFQQQQQIQETQQIQQEEVGPPLGISVINFHAFDGDSVNTDTWMLGAEEPQGSCDFSPALHGTPILQCHCASAGFSRDKVIILSPEVPPERDLSVLETAL